MKRFGRSPPTPSFCTGPSPTPLAVARLRRSTARSAGSPRASRSSPRTSVRPVDRGGLVHERHRSTHSRPARDAAADQRRGRSTPHGLLGDLRLRDDPAVHGRVLGSAVRVQGRGVHPAVPRALHSATLAGARSCRGKAHRREADGRVPLHSERRTVTDGGGVDAAPRRRERRGVFGRFGSRERGESCRRQSDGRGRHRYLERVPEAVDGRGRPRRGRDRDDGLRRLLSDLPRQALSRLGGRRPRGASSRAGPPDPRRDRRAGVWTRRRARPTGLCGAVADRSAERRSRVRLLVVGGSDAGIAAALRAREIDPSVEVTVALADTYPNYSICGLPYFVAGDVPDWRSLPHPNGEENPGARLELLLEHTARGIDPAAKLVKLTDGAAHEVILAYDRLVVATGAAP